MKHDDCTLPNARFELTVAGVTCTVCERIDTFLVQSEGSTDPKIGLYRQLIMAVMVDFTKTAHIQLLIAALILLREIEEYDVTAAPDPDRLPGETDDQYKTRLAFLRLFE